MAPPLPRGASARGALLLPLLLLCVSCLPALLVVGSCADESGPLLTQIVSSSECPSVQEMAFDAIDHDAIWVRCRTLIMRASITNATSFFKFPLLRSRMAVDPIRGDLLIQTQDGMYRAAGGGSVLLLLFTLPGPQCTTSTTDAAIIARGRFLWMQCLATGDHRMRLHRVEVDTGDVEDVSPSGCVERDMMISMDEHGEELLVTCQSAGVYHITNLNSSDSRPVMLLPNSAVAELCIDGIHSAMRDWSTQQLVVRCVSNSARGGLVLVDLSSSDQPDVRSLSSDHFCYLAGSQLSTKGGTTWFGLCGGKAYAIQAVGRDSVQLNPDSVPTEVMLRNRSDGSMLLGGINGIWRLDGSTLSRAIHSRSCAMVDDLSSLPDGRTAFLCNDAMGNSVAVTSNGASASIEPILPPRFCPGANQILFSQSLWGILVSCIQGPIPIYAVDLGDQQRVVHPIRLPPNNGLNRMFDSPFGALLALESSVMLVPPPSARNATLFFDDGSTICEQGLRLHDAAIAEDWLLLLCPKVLRAIQLSVQQTPTGAVPRPSGVEHELTLHSCTEGSMSVDLPSRRALFTCDSALWSMSLVDPKLESIMPLQPSRSSVFDAHRRLLYLITASLQFQAWHLDSARQLAMINLAHMKFLRQVRLEPVTGAVYFASLTQALVYARDFTCAPGMEFRQGECTPCLPSMARRGSAYERGRIAKCAMCVDGSISSMEGMATCTPCAPGTFHDLNLGQVCRPCAPGLYQNETAQTKCATCPFGHYSAAQGATRCIPCSPGMFNDEVGMTKCAPCQPGRAAPNMGQKHCNDCPAGSYADIQGLAECIPCSRGTASNETGRSRRCGDCPAGSEQPLYGMRSCTACPLGSFADVGAACAVCPVRTYTPTVGAHCVSCQEADQDGLVCRGGLATVEEGYWAFQKWDEEERQFVYRTVECPVGLCPGGALQAVNISSGALLPTPPRCQYPRVDSPDNWVCAECVPGYIPWQDDCLQCDGVNGGRVFLVLLYSLAIVLFLLARGASSAGQVAVFLYFIQTAALEIDGVSRWLSWLQAANLSLNSTAGSCLAPLSPLQQLALTLATPFILLALLLLVGAVHWSLRRCIIPAADRPEAPPPELSESMSDSMQSSSLSLLRARVHSRFHQMLLAFHIDQYICTALAILVFTYTGISMALVEILHCKQLSEGVSRLYVAPTVDCHSESYRSFRMIAIIYMVAFPIGFPLAIFFFLWRRRTHLQLVHSQPAAAAVSDSNLAPDASPLSVDVTSSSFTQRYGCLFVSYTPRAWFWTPVTLLRRFAFALAAALLADVSQVHTRFALFLCFHLASLAGQLWARPFTSSSLNRADIGAQASLLLLSNLLVGVEPPYSLATQLLALMLVVPPALALLAWTMRAKLVQLTKTLRRKRNRRQNEEATAPAAGDSDAADSSRQPSPPVHRPPVSASVPSSFAPMLLFESPSIEMKEPLLPAQS